MWHILKKYDKSVEINHNPNWPFIPGNPHKIYLNKIYLYVRDPFKSNINYLTEEEK